MEKAEEDPALELVQGTVRTYPVKNLHKLTPKVTLTKVASNEDARKCYYHMGQLIVAAWNKLIKRSFLIKHSIFFIEGVIYEDTPWMFIMLKHLKSISFVGTVSYYYKLRSKSIVTSSTSVKKAESFRKNYHEIITNLTPYHEHEEVMYYARKFSYFYARYSFLDTGYKELMKKWIEKSREYGNWGIRLRLGLSRIFGRIRYGWLLLSLLFRIEEPSLIPIDIRRLLYRFNLIRS